MLRYRYLLTSLVDPGRMSRSGLDKVSFYEKSECLRLVCIAKSLPKFGGDGGIYRRRWPAMGLGFCLHMVASY